jgi:RNA polymerase sigma factor (sigma-70 family)
MREPDTVARAAQRDPEAIGALYRAHAADLHRLMYRLTGSAADAEDLLHDLFVGLPELLRRYDERGKLAPWLRRVAARMALMRMRGVRRRGEVAMDEAPAAALHARDASPEGAWDLERALAALPAPLRSVFVLKQMEGYTHAEIARILDITGGASRVRHLRALRQLRKLLETP